MIDFLKLRETIENMTAQDALIEIDNVLSRQGDNPDANVLLLRAETLFDLAGEEDDYSCYDDVIEILCKILHNETLCLFYPHMLDLIISSYISLNEYDNALDYALKFYDTHYDDTNAAYYLAVIYHELHFGDETAGYNVDALRMVDEYLACGEFPNGASLKIDILSSLGRYDDALELIEFCESAHPEDEDIWIDRRIDYYFDAGAYIKGVEYLKSLLNSNRTKKERKHFFVNICSMTSRVYDETGEAAKNSALFAYADEYIIKFPDDGFAYAFKAKMTENVNLDACIGYLEKAVGFDGVAAYGTYLRGKYLIRGSKEDAAKYFDLVKNAPDDKTQNWNMAREIIYGRFAEFDKGQAIGILERELLRDPDYECNYSLLGRAYESGIGTSPSPEKAYEYYKKAYERKYYCNCGAIFSSNALYYGNGMRKDVGRAKELILEVFSEEGRNEPDRVCLYAICAFDGHSGFDKNKAVAHLKEYADKDHISAFLLSKFSESAAEKARYWDTTLKLFEEADYLEKVHFKKYIENPKLPYKHLVRN